ncbi:putative LOC729966 homolog [Macrotis lagotis]|uniref:putative LOC729966 homolog n=1 Tax=Macrotis lagotis TaxID=92651 RepID=UPI003D698E76
MLNHSTLRARSPRLSAWWPGPGGQRRVCAQVRRWDGGLSDSPSGNLPREGRQPETGIREPFPSWGPAEILPLAMPGRPLLFVLLLLSGTLDGAGGNGTSSSTTNSSPTTFSIISHSISPSTTTSHSDSASQNTFHKSPPSDASTHSISPSTTTSHSGSTFHKSSSPSSASTHNVSPSTTTSHSDSTSQTTFHKDSPSTTSTHNVSLSTTTSHSGSTSHTIQHFSPNTHEGSSPNPSISSGASSPTTSMKIPEEGSTKLESSTSSVETQRNPSVVIVVCLFVSILVLGSVLVAVKCCRKNVKGFEKMDEMSMETVREEAPFARFPPQ